MEFVHSEAEIVPAQLMALQILKVLKEAEDLKIRGDEDRGDRDRDDDASGEGGNSNSETADDDKPGADKLGGAADGGPANVGGGGSKLTLDDTADITVLEQPGPSSTTTVSGATRGLVSTHIPRQGHGFVHDTVRSTPLEDSVGDGLSFHAHVRPPPLLAARKVGEVSEVVDGPKYSFELRHIMFGIEIERPPRSAASPFPRLRGRNAHMTRRSPLDQKWRTPTTFRPIHLWHRSLHQADVERPPHPKAPRPVSLRDLRTRPRCR
jgi:hypothetical protein